MYIIVLNSTTLVLVTLLLDMHYGIYYLYTQNYFENPALIMIRTSAKDVMLFSVIWWFCGSFV